MTKNQTNYHKNSGVNVHRVIQHLTQNKSFNLIWKKSYFVCESSNPIELYITNYPTLYFVHTVIKKKYEL